ncbi:OmpA family protein [Namhaeicola litoreus]|uniref:OmpA family protein n=1 Tax=Namhaeicola litoreus TaxID=1052145 RepID=A0ABW3XXR5_9FLAO
MKRNITLIFLLLSYLFVSSQTTPGVYTIKNLDINTKYSDFGAAFYGNDRVVFASPTDEVKVVRKLWKENGQPFLDLYTGLITDDRQVIDKKQLPGEVNTKFHEGGVVFSKNLNKVYFTANNYFEKEFLTDSAGINTLQIFMAYKDVNGKWMEKVKLPFNNQQYSYGHPALNYDETKLYFVSDMPGGYGETDIYYVDIRNDGSFGDPINMGPKVNSQGKEMFPFVGKDNVLYFTSNGHPGYGQLDVFASKIYDNSVSEPLNLGQPVNSEKDDFSFIIDDVKDRGFFSSNRDEGKGDDDIYSFLAKPGIYIHCTQQITGVVRSESTGELLPGALVELRNAAGEVIESTTASAADARYFLNSAVCDSSFVVVGSNKGYLNDETPIVTVNDIDNEAIVADLNLPDQFVSNKVNIKTIYFDFDKFNIRPDAAKELDKVVQVMNEYPELLIEAGSHTDSRGKDKYNQKLSEKRAKSTVDYIVSKGIDAGRITYKGYGETELVNDCGNNANCTEEQHQLNRRTEFKIANETGFELVPLNE